MRSTDDPSKTTETPARRPTFGSPCKCFGAPINPVWSRTRKHIGYECGSCGRRWLWELEDVHA
jgi:hypothetical protein